MNGLESINAEQRKTLAAEINVNLVTQDDDSAWDLPSEQRTMFTTSTRRSDYSTWIKSPGPVVVETCVADVCNPYTTTVTSTGEITITGDVSVPTSFVAAVSDVDAVATLVPETSLLASSSIEADSVQTTPLLGGDSGFSTSILALGLTNSSSIAPIQGGSSKMTVTSLAGLIFALAALA